MKKTLLLVFTPILGLLLCGAALAYWYAARLTAEPPKPELVAASKRSIDSGDLTGYSDGATFAWLGIPFAAPPIDTLRWRAPRPVKRWGDRTLKATSPGAECVQRLGEVEDIDGSEDCLYLNLWSPKEQPAKPLPVMFWIHGGGNQLGSGSTSIYNGARLAATHNVLVVTINYRLGPFGWFAHPDLAATPATDQGFTRADASGNFGTLDIIAALRWVQRNAAVFGGDPHNITLFGESAGGFDVLSLMISPLAKGLYHKAIVQSGGLTLQSLSLAGNYIDDTEPGHPISARETTNQLLITSGAAADRVAAKAMQTDMSPDKISDFLRGLNPLQIMNAVHRPPPDDSVAKPFVVGPALASAPPSLFGDGYVLPADIQINELFSDASRYNVTPVILGSNRDETKLFNALSRAYVQRIAGLPIDIRQPALYDRDSNYGSQMWKAIAVDELAIRLSSSQGESVFAYRFDWDDWNSLPWLDTARLLGASHASELPFVFGNFDLVDKALLVDAQDIVERDVLSAHMMAYWAEFAHTGDPGRGYDQAGPLWQPWLNPGAPGDRLLLLDTKTDGGVRMSPMLVTVETIRATLLSDTSFASTPRRLCEMYALLFTGKAFDAQEYASLHETCVSSDLTLN
jgi:para-nitrobenzyl esterase